LEMLEGLPAAAHNAREGIFSHDNRQAGFLLEQPVEIVQQGPPAGERNTLVRDIGTKLRWRLLQCRLDGGHDLVERIGERFENFVGRYRETAGNTLGKIAALDLDLADFRA